MWLVGATSQPASHVWSPAEVEVRAKKSEYHLEKETNEGTHRILLRELGSTVEEIAPQMTLNAKGVLRSQREKRDSG